VVGSEVNKDAAWMYREPTQPAANIKGYFSFWKGTEVQE